MAENSRKFPKMCRKCAGHFLVIVSHFRHFSTIFSSLPTILDRHFRPIFGYCRQIYVIFGPFTIYFRTGAAHFRSFRSFSAIFSHFRQFREFSTHFRPIFGLFTIYFLPVSKKSTENARQWPKDDQNGQNGPKMADNDQKMTEMTENVPQLFENGP